MLRCSPAPGRAQASSVSPLSTNAACSVDLSCLCPSTPPAQKRVARARALGPSRARRSRITPCHCLLTRRLRTTPNEGDHNVISATLNVAAHSATPVTLREPYMRAHPRCGRGTPRAICRERGWLQARDLAWRASSALRGAYQLARAQDAEHGGVVDQPAAHARCCVRALVR
jgi:hypothetical protein